MRVFTLVILELVYQVPIPGGERHSRIAPSTARVGTTEALVKAMYRTMRVTEGIISETMDA